MPQIKKINYMKISDELRILSDESDIDCGARVKLRKLADRIGAELVELPKDADGVPIHVGMRCIRQAVKSQ